MQIGYWSPSLPTILGKSIFNVSEPLFIFWQFLDHQRHEIWTACSSAPFYKNRNIFCHIWCFYKHWSYIYLWMYLLCSGLRDGWPGDDAGGERICGRHNGSISLQLAAGGWGWNWPDAWQVQPPGLRRSIQRRLWRQSHGEQRGRDAG